MYLIILVKKSMIANKFSLIALAIFLSSCTGYKTNKIKIPQNSCKPSDIEFQFEPVKDLSSSLRNQELASLYFYQQKEQTNITIDCYEKLISEVNK